MRIMLVASRLNTPKVPVVCIEDVDANRPLDEVLGTWIVNESPMSDQTYTAGEVFWAVAVRADGKATYFVGHAEDGDCLGGFDAASLKALNAAATAAEKVRATLLARLAS